MTIKNHIISAIASARLDYDIPFISLALDLIQNRIQNKKLIGIHITYTDKGVTYSWTLAVSGYNPTEKQWNEGLQASYLLVQWCSGIVSEFGIDMERDILTSCTDSGSDVKRALEKVFVTYREWCISHLTHLALVDAFGCHLDKTKSKNIEARSVIEC